MSRPRTSRRARISQHGFTLLELMVAATAGAFVISSVVYFMGSMNAFFREHQRISTTQSSLRTAMDHIRRDFTRAGFGATPNSRFPEYQPQSCGPGVGINNWIRAIEVFDQERGGLVDPNGEHMIDDAPLQGDRVRLMGNYATSADYLINEVTGGGFSVPLQTARMAYTRDFTRWHDPPPYVTDPIIFQEAFPDGRMVRLRATDGSRFFAVINGTAPNLNPPLVNINVPMNIGCASFQGGRMNPVSVMDYMLVPADANTANRDAVAAGVNVQLVRQEISIVNNGQLPGTVNQIIAESVVNFNVDLMVNTNATRTTTATLAASWGNNVNAAPPERIFSAIVTLALRTQIPGPSFPWIRQGPGEELTRYRFRPDPDRRASRVRIGRTEIFLPNIAYEWNN